MRRQYSTAMDCPWRPFKLISVCRVDVVARPRRPRARFADGHSCLIVKTPFSWACIYNQFLIRLPVERDLCGHHCPSAEKAEVRLLGLLLTFQFYCCLFFYWNHDSFGQEEEEEQE